MIRRDEDDDKKKNKISWVAGSKAKVFAFFFSFLFLSALFLVGGNAKAETTPTPFLVAKYKDFADYANYSTFDDPFENNTNVSFVLYNDITITSGLLLKNYSYDDSQYIKLYTNSSGTYSYHSAVILAEQDEGDADVKTIEFDCRMEKDSLVYIGYAIGSLKEMWQIIITNDSVTIKFYKDSLNIYTIGYANDTLIKINNSEWIKIIYSIDTISPYETTHAVLAIDQQVYQYNYTSIYDTASSIQVSLGFTTYKHFANLEVENFAWYSKSLTASDIEHIYSPASIAFSNIGDLIVSVLPIFMVVGLVGIMINKIKDVKFRRD